MDLELINMTPEKLLIAIERASRARYRYVYARADAGQRVDVPIEHQLTNHVTLLQDIAQAVGLDSEVVVQAMQRGATRAFDERG